MQTEPKDLFAEHFVANQRRIYGYIMTLLGNQADAEEIFQQTSLLLWKKWDSFDPAADFVRWACGIAHNEVRNFIRLRRHKDVFLSQAMLDELSQLRLSRQEGQSDRHQALGECLARLPKHHREFIELCYRGTQSMKSIAESLRLAPSAAYVKLHRLRSVLLKCIESMLTGGGA